jgi:hypothetical protein
MLALLLAAASWPAPARAEDAAMTERLSELHQAYYNDGVLEYCGLYTDEVYDGFLRRVRFLLRGGGIDTETHRRVRISGWIDADYQYGNHGLGRYWCKTDGRRAVQEFLTFRRLELMGKVP